MLIKLFYDFVCPFSYIAKKIFDRLSSKYDIKIEYVCYELYPKIGKNGILTKDLFEVLPSYSNILKILDSIGRSYGISINDVRKKFNTRDAMVYSKIAKKYNRESEYIDLVYKAMYEENRNISENYLIREVLNDLGIYEDLYKDDVSSAYKEFSLDFAKSIDNEITGVPCVIINGTEKIQGLREEKYYESRLHSLKINEFV